jgi:hypothetical protein
MDFIIGKPPVQLIALVQILRPPALFQATAGQIFPLLMGSTQSIQIIYSSSIG